MHWIRRPPLVGQRRHVRNQLAQWYVPVVQLAPEISHRAPRGLALLRGPTLVYRGPKLLARVLVRILVPLLFRVLEVVAAGVSACSRGLRG